MGKAGDAICGHFKPLRPRNSLFWRDHNAPHFSAILVFRICNLTFLPPRDEMDWNRMLGSPLDLPVRSSATQPPTIAQTGKGPRPFNIPAHAAEKLPFKVPHSLDKGERMSPHFGTALTTWELKCVHVARHIGLNGHRRWKSADGIFDRPCRSWPDLGGIR
jgi:hypothetical protein